MSSVMPVIYDVTIASFATSSSGIALERSWPYQFLKVPSMTSNTEIYVNASDDGTTYRPIYHPMGNAVAPTGNRFLVNSAIGSNGGMVPIPNGFRYVKVEVSAIVSFTAAFKIVCSE